VVYICPFETATGLALIPALVVPVSAGRHLSARMYLLGYHVWITSSNFSAHGRYRGHRLSWSTIIVRVMENTTRHKFEGGMTPPPMARPHSWAPRKVGFF